MTGKSGNGARLAWCAAAVMLAVAMPGQAQDGARPPAGEPAAAQLAQAQPSLVSAGTVVIEQYQIAFIGSGNLGGGTLHYKGRSYPFTIGGLGIGGIGFSKIEATGEVYNMTDVAHFGGAYGQARAGIVAADMSTGTLWLENPAGVYMKLQAKRQGLALSLGADAVYIQMK